MNYGSVVDYSLTLATRTLLAGHELSEGGYELTLPENNEFLCDELEAIGSDIELFMLDESQAYFQG